MTRIIITVAIAVFAALSGAILVQGRALKSVRADLATVNKALVTCQSEKASITASAAACSRSVEEAAAMSAKRATDAQAATAAAQARVNEASKRVAELLRQRPADPTDLCKSTDIMLTQWIKRRAKP